jgi:hypothetical protein
MNFLRNLYLEIRGKYVTMLGSVAYNASSSELLRLGFNISGAMIVG